ncbi:uncharacterized protein CC84DRAFT_451051 [Paraphaeosphaeria sporulosa]|uniref:Uncharacterized protein n=1 Tax=Paraphaeosphaeria sporulosa TaxID=1460663 RepID=A0A177CQ96_9PLEO|nr:uncharacterized protein CC84DRAFT_451051 [Paraphaeosphaeria sporulosa]OAG09695.1 hypothetical protein CC84DRAFT_451051 [Paraphaeosphaeria sporulosa]
MKLTSRANALTTVIERPSHLNRKRERTHSRRRQCSHRLDPYNPQLALRLRRVHHNMDTVELQQGPQAPRLHMDNLIHRYRRLRMGKDKRKATGPKRSQYNIHTPSRRNSTTPMDRRPLRLHRAGERTQAKDNIHTIKDLHQVQTRLLAPQDHIVRQI